MTTETLDKLTLLQDALNESITTDWKNNRTELDFMVANTLEMAELIDTTYTIDGKKHGLDWKWWKDNDSSKRTMDVVNWDDLHPKVLDNIKIELTDLLFFTLSQTVLGDLSDPDDYIALNENDWVNFMSIAAMNLLQRPKTALQMIILLAEKIDFNISAYYIAKHTLNHIRQLTGYKDGSYVKVNDGVEDNELLHSIIEKVTISDIEGNFNGVADTIMIGVYDTFNVAEEDRMNMVKWAEVIVNTINPEDLIPTVEDVVENNEK